jgi:hypothetical protein
MSRRAALAAAEDVRRRRAEVVGEIAAGRVTLDEAFELADLDELVARVKLLSLLESVPGVGKVGSRRMLASLGIPESTRTGAVGPDDRRRLLDALTAAS